MRKQPRRRACEAIGSRIDVPFQRTGFYRVLYRDPVEWFGRRCATSAVLGLSAVPRPTHHPMSRRIDRTTPAASGTATQKTIENEICGT